jgi:plastocyanin
MKKIALTLAAALGIFSVFPAAAQTSTFQTRIDIKHSRQRSPQSHDENAVVWLWPLDRTAQPLQALEQRYEMVQRDKQFHPHVLAIPVGAAVVFPNDDPFFHNVFSLYQGKKFDLGLYEAGSSRSVRFDKPGVSFIFCNIHPEMSAYLIALDTPYFTVTGADGVARIPGVSPGRYRMQVWYEWAESDELNHLAREITLPNDATSIARIQLHESERMMPAHNDKHGRPYEADRPPYQQ